MSADNKIGQNDNNGFRLFADLEGRKEEDVIRKITTKVKASPNFIINGNFEGAHILSAEQFTKNDLRSIFDGTYLLRAMNKRNDLRRLKICEGIIMIPLFYEPSSRTDLSHNSAMQDLG